jgi:hypothetical protein
MKKIILFAAFIGSITSYAQEKNIEVTPYPKEALVDFNGDINAGSARSQAMGGALGALGGDISSTNQNPAGLAVNIKSNFSFTPKVTSYENTTKYGSTTSTDDVNLAFSQIGGFLVIPIPTINGVESKWKNVVLAANYEVESLKEDLIYSANSDRIFTDTDRENSTFDAYGTIKTGTRKKINFNISGNYNDQLYLGFGTNIHSTDTETQTSYSEVDTDLSTTFGYNQNATPYTNSGTGFSLSIGGIAKLNQNVRIGVAYHSPVWWNVTQEYIYQDISTIPTSEQLTGLSEFDVTAGGRAVGSLGLVLGKQLALDVDYTHHMNNGTKYKPVISYAQSNDFFKANLKNSAEVRVGGEYRYEGWRMRAGYKYIESPFASGNHTYTNESDISETKTLSEYTVGDQFIYSGGIGYQFNYMYIDLTYQRVKQDYTHFIGGVFVDPTLNDDGVIDLGSNLTEVESVKNNFLFTIGWNF